LDLRDATWKTARRTEGVLVTNGKPTEDATSLGAESWGRGLLKAALVLILAWGGFLFIPNKLLAYLTTRVTPHARDLLVTLWVVVFFVALSVIFVVLQKGRRQ
jgi:hypothetical protein